MNCVLELYLNMNDMHGSDKRNIMYKTQSLHLTHSFSVQVWIITEYNDTKSIITLTWKKVHKCEDFGSKNRCIQGKVKQYIMEELKPLNTTTNKLLN